MAYRKDDSSQIKKRLQFQERREERYTRNAASSSESKSTLAVNKKSVFSNDRQRKEAELVHKLPKDFPMDRWDKMPTKPQLSTMRYSGLNEQDQWALLNASTPLGTLSVLNKIQGGLDAKLHSPQKAAELANTANLLASEHKALNSATASDLPSLQKRLLRGELDRKLDALRTNVDRTTNPALKATATFDRNPTRRAGSSIGITLTSTPKPEATPKPDDKPTGLFGWLKTLFSGSSSREEKESKQKPVLFETVPPVKTPKMTPSPKPTPMPTPTSVPTPSERENLANDGIAFAKGVIGKPYSNSGRFGTKGYDCSGLVIAMCEDMKSELPFDNVHIKTTTKYGMSQSFLNNPEYGEPIYNYQDGGSISDLQAGDLVFSANQGNLKLDSHVSIATGEMIYDSSTGEYWPQVIEASSVAGKGTNIYPAFNKLDNKGYYSRSHTNQIITYVIRPNYDWEENP